MARTFNNNVANRLTNASTLGITDWPVTFACWAKPANATANHGLINFGDASASTPYLYFWLDGGTAGDPLRVGTVNPTVLGVNSSNSFTASAWNSCVGVYENTQRTAYLNGTKTTATVSSMTWPSGLDVTGVGLLERSGRSQPMNGDIAWATVWDVALTDDEAAAFAKGAHPLSIRPESIVAFWPLNDGDGDANDWVGGYTLTETGTVATAESRAILPYRRAQIFVPQVAAGGGTESAPASSAGTATATATGGSIASASANSAGSATATATGAAVAASVLNAAGAATGTLEGSEVAVGVESGAASSEGAATATAASASIASAAASADGSATATAAGASTADGALSAAGVATATAVGSNTDAVVTPTRYDGWLPREVIRMQRKRREEKALIALVMAMDRDMRQAA